MWIIYRKDNRKIISYGPQKLREGTYDVALVDITEVPDQDLSHIIQRDEEGHRIITGVYPHDIQLYSKKEKEALIDRDTGKAINKAIHQFAGTEEHFAILREQLAQVVADSGKQPAKKFQGLCDIAEAEIAKGQKKKDALKE